MTLAFLFPGQGSQSVGMAKELVGELACAREAFAEADAALGFSLSRLCFEGPESDLALTANAQPAILTASVAALRALRERTSLEPTLVAGHSLGEYTALVCVGALSLTDAVKLVRARGVAMQAAVPVGAGGMAALGAGIDVADALCKQAAGGEVLSPANYNGPAQTIVAGSVAALERLVVLAESQRIACKLLKVSAPFHCALMEPVVPRLADAFAAVTLHPFSTPVVSNVDAEPYTDAPTQRLLRQVTAPVRWIESMQTLKAQGVTRAIEIGPGKVLSGLMRRIDPSVLVSPCASPADLVSLQNP